MRVHRGPLAIVAAAAVAGGVLLAGGPAQSQTPSASIVANDNEFRTDAGGAATITVDAGATVGFAQGGTHRHNVVFKDAQPTCVQTAGTSSGSVPPLPNQATSTPWAGTCTFTAPGTYTFYCAFHGEGMNGSVTVAPPPVAAPVPTPGPVPPPPPPPSIATVPAASGLRVASPQQGLTLRGSVSIRSAGSRLLARAFAGRGALSGGRSALQVEVGRRLRSSVGPGRVPFSVSLTAAARRALRRNGRLAITFRLTVSPPAGSGTAYTATRNVILRAP